MRLRAYHNVRQDGQGRAAALLDGYTPGDPVVLVLDIDVVGPRPHEAPDWLYRLLDVGDDPQFGEPFVDAVAYRMRRNRAMSVGDVICVDKKWLAVAHHGWTEIEAPHVVREAVPGTAPWHVWDACIHSSITRRPWRNGTTLCACGEVLPAPPTQTRRAGDE